MHPWQSVIQTMLLSSVRIKHQTATRNDPNFRSYLLILIRRQLPMCRATGVTSIQILSSSTSSASAISAVIFSIGLIDKKQPPPLKATVCPAPFISARLAKIRSFIQDANSNPSTDDQHSKDDLIQLPKSRWLQKRCNGS